MKRLALTALFLLVASSCAVYHDRYGTEVAVAPEFWGTVTYVDPGAHYINLDYYNGSVREPRVIYYGRGTRWDSLSIPISEWALRSGFAATSIADVGKPKICATIESRRVSR